MIILTPGKQAAQGVGVYCSLGRPDLRASDSCYENGMKTMFCLKIYEPKRLWYTSKGGRDRKKARPQTWHTKGKNLSVHIEAKVEKEGVTYIVGDAFLG